MTDRYSYSELRRSDSFARWAKGEASEDEKKFWDRWVASDVKNRELARQVQQRIAGVNVGDARRGLCVAVFGRLEGRIESEREAGEVYGHRAAEDEVTNKSRTPKAGDIRKSPTADLAAGVDSRAGGDAPASAINRSGSARTVKHHRPPGPVRTLWTRHAVWISRAAALLLLILTSYMVSHIYRGLPEPEPVAEVLRSEVSTDFGERKRVQLPDGSELTLNGNTSLSYTMASGKQSEIELNLDGEAYFNVTRRGGDVDRPFLIQTPDGTIAVLGTSFSVSTRDQMTRVVLEQGSVAIQPHQTGSEILMEPGQLAEFSSHYGSFETRQVNTDLYTSWVDGRLQFRSVYHTLEILSRGLLVCRLQY